MKNIKYQVIVPDPNKIYTYPGEGCGFDPPPGWVRPTPVKPFSPQLTRRSSGTEEIDAVVQTVGELLSGAFWFSCFFIFKCFEISAGHSRKK